MNLFLFDVPRLSLDIDLNYIGSENRETMLTEKDEISLAFESIFEQNGYRLKGKPTEYAGGKWQIGFDSALGRPGVLAIDTAFTSRVPLWSVERFDSRPISTLQTLNVPVLDVHELAAGKLKALFSRNASRDLFDTRLLFNSSKLDMAKLRLTFVVYGASDKKDWRTVNTTHIGCDWREAQRQLVPLLRNHESIDREGIQKWIGELVGECQHFATSILPLEENEREFLRQVEERAEIKPELLTDDEDLGNRIRRQTHLLWKVQNVRKIKGLADSPKG